MQIATENSMIYLHGSRCPPKSGVIDTYSIKAAHRAPPWLAVLHASRAGYSDSSEMTCSKLFRLQKQYGSFSKERYLPLNSSLSF